MAAGSTQPLLYQGGSVLRSVKIYVVFWGPEWLATSQIPAVGYIDGFYNDLGGSRWAGIMAQYCSGIAINLSTCPLGASFIQNPVAQLKGAVFDTTPVPAVPTGADIGNRAAAAAAYYGYPGGALYMVHTPSGKSQSGFGTQFCAYHTWLYAGGTRVPYGYMPYQPDAGGSCGAYSVRGPMDGFAIVGGHEYAEAVTDPYPSGWAGVTGWLDTTLGWTGEIGDKCAWKLGIVTMNGNTWPVQKLFSNQDLALSQSGCVLAPPVTTVTSVVPGQGPMAGGTTVAINGTTFINVTAVRFGSAAATAYSVTSAAQVVATSPPGTGTVDVTVTDQYGTSTTGPADMFTYFGVPGAPTAVSATAGNAAATVNWTTPPSTGGSPITAYRVTPYLALIAQTPIAVGLVSAMTVTGLTNGTAYTFTVATVNAAGRSVESSQSNSVTPATVPGRPTGVSALAGTAQATVRWTAPIDAGGSPIVRYIVNCSPTCTPVMVGGSSLQAVVVGLPADSSSSFTVTAANLVGAGLPSAASGLIRLREAAAQATPGPPAAREPAKQSIGGSTPAPRTVARAAAVGLVAG